MKKYLQLHELNTEELLKRRQASHTLMGALAGLFFVWLIVIFYTGFFNLGYLGFIFLFLSIIKYIDMRYYDTMVRFKETQREQWPRVN